MEVSNGDISKNYDRTSGPQGYLKETRDSTSKVPSSQLQELDFNFLLELHQKGSQTRMCCHMSVYYDNRKMINMEF